MNLRAAIADLREGVRSVLLVEPSGGAVRRRAHIEGSTRGGPVARAIGPSASGSSARGSVRSGPSLGLTMRGPQESGPRRDAGAQPVELLVPEAGLEPAQGFPQRILGPRSPPWARRGMGRHRAPSRSINALHRGFLAMLPMARETSRTWPAHGPLSDDPGRVAGRGALRLRIKVGPLAYTRGSNAPGDIGSEPSSGATNSVECTSVGC